MIFLKPLIWVWAGGVLFITWWPNSRFWDVDLSNSIVQLAVFNLGAVILVLHVPGRRVVYSTKTDSEFVGSLNEWRAQIVRIPIGLALVSILTQLGQILVPARHVDLKGLLENSGLVFLSSVAIAIGANILVSTHVMRRYRQQAVGVSASFRSEASYAALLRDAIQAGYAVCRDPHQPAEEKIEKVRMLLNCALAAEIPQHQEVTMNQTYGKGKAIVMSSSKVLGLRLRGMLRLR